MSYKQRVATRGWAPASKLVSVLKLVGFAQNSEIVGFGDLKFKLPSRTGANQHRCLTQTSVWTPPRHRRIFIPAEARCAFEASVQGLSRRQIIATSHDRFPPKGSCLEGKWDPLIFRETWVGEIFEFDQMYWPQGSWICRKNPGFPLQSYDRLEWDVSTINPNRIFGRGFWGFWG